MPYYDSKRKQWKAVVKHSGKRHIHRCRRKREAQEWEVRKREELETMEVRTQTGLDLLTFCNEYLEYAQTLSYKTFDEKRTLSKRILKAWGPETPVAQLTPQTILKYLQEQAKLRSPSAFNKDRKNLHAMWEWGRIFLDLPENPISKIKRMGVDRSSQYCPPPEDVLRILAVATREERIFLYSYVLTGARRSEIFRWTWNDDINFRTRQYRLGTRKTRDGSMEYEWFPMPDLLYEELKWWYENRPVKNTPYVFVSTYPPFYGKPFTARRRFMYGLCKRAGVKPFGFQALRRYFGSILADEYKQSPKTIQRLLRHSNLATTERYLKNLNRDLKTVLEMVADSLQKGHQEGAPKEEEASEEDR